MAHGLSEVWAWPTTDSPRFPWTCSSGAGPGHEAWEEPLGIRVAPASGLLRPPRDGLAPRPLGD